MKNNYKYLKYNFLLQKEINPKNKKILMNLINQNKKDIESKNKSISRFSYYLFIFLYYIFGSFFALKFLEKNTTNLKIIKDFEDKKINYLSSIVLGLSDSLIEITGVLCGLTITFSDTNIIGFVGLIVGISASLSMGASEFLSNLEEKNKSSYVSAIYTGFSYFFSVIFLVTPFFIFENRLISITLTFIVAILIVAIYNFFTSIVEEKNFRKSFLKMFLILFIVSIISFILSQSIKSIFGIEI